MIVPPLHGGGKGLNLLGSMLARMDTSSVLFSIYYLSSTNVSCPSNRECSPQSNIVESTRREASAAAPSRVSSVLVAGAGVSGSSPLVGSLFFLQNAKEQEALNTITRGFVSSTSAVNSIQKPRPLPWRATSVGGTLQVV
jgi:hypothetical protein